MSLSTHPVVTPRHASTLILLRDSAEGPEVLMLKRSGLSDVLGDAYVFPGGKLDAVDFQLDPRICLDEQPAFLQRRISDALCDPETAAALFVAAIRETFEESGILMVNGATAPLCAQLACRLRDGASFSETLSESNLILSVSALAPWSRWITPISSLQPKRFDTRFFVARAPEGVQARHDGHETTESTWMRPRQAMERYWAREINLAPPQIMTLVDLSDERDVASILAAAHSRVPPLVQPVILESEDGLKLCYPGDPGHGQPERAMRGPLRLAIRNGRYEPENGFEAFFEGRVRTFV
ncbi:NUDIX hydrolase [Delftia tsuruhatensis]|uniref:NUDIX hydrolase n=1 Tax=Delftia tsuruhatensis TaxID=180282 RepID=UPI003D197907